MSFDSDTFIGQMFDQHTNRLSFGRWLVQRRYMNLWKSRGHRVCRPGRPDDGQIPLRPNGQREWAVPISKAIKFKGEAVAVEAPPEEAAFVVNDVGAETATAEPLKKRRKRAVSS